MDSNEQPTPEELYGVIRMRLFALNGPITNIRDSQSATVAREKIDTVIKELQELRGFADFYATFGEEVASPEWFSLEDVKAITGSVKSKKQRGKVKRWSPFF